MVDHEFPPHVTPVIREAPASPSGGSTHKGSMIPR
jgi:hypothetical protein